MTDEQKAAYQEQLETLKKGITTEVSAKAKEEAEKLIKGLEDKINGNATKADVEEVKSSIKVIKDAQDKIIEAQDKLIAERKNIKLFGEGIDKDSFKAKLDEELKAKADKLKNYKNSRESIQLDLKAVGDIGSANFTTSGTVTFAGPTMIPGVQGLAYRSTHVRDILGTQSVNTDSVAVIRAVAGEGAPTAVAAAAVKPQSDADWVKVIIPITKVAHYYTVPEEWLEDVSWLSADITNTGIHELMKVEDNMLISNNTAGQFTGLVQNSTAYAAPTGLALGIEAANNYDALVSAMVQLRNANREPNFILTDNDSWARMILTKATTGEYVFGAPNVSIPNVFGVPIYPMTVTALADKFIVGDRSQAVVAVRSGISVRFYDQHANNAIYNLVTIVIEERIALVVKRTDAFIYGDFSDTRAALETA